MLPKGHLGKEMIKKLYVYAGNEHKKQDRNPIPVELTKKWEEK